MEGEVKLLEKEIEGLRNALVEKEQQLIKLKSGLSKIINVKRNGDHIEIPDKLKTVQSMPQSSIERYSRQILVPELGFDGQVKLNGSKVIIIGAGGLGCPAALYLAGAGVGEIGILDYDTLEESNLHRQVLHTEEYIGRSKAESAVHSLKRMNTKITLKAFTLKLCSENVLEILSSYDLVVDATDNAVTRYLLNDACVMLKIPLVSGSALKLEGQLTIYNYKDEDGTKGPCYRCVFPKPPPPEAVGSCSANGVLGPVPGVIGCLQAIEAIKVLISRPRAELLVGRLLLFDGADCTFRNFKLRPPIQDCCVCSDKPTITKLIDYELFCKAQAVEKDVPLKILPKYHRITPRELIEKVKNERHLLVDVRTPGEYKMCRMQGSINRPIDDTDIKTLLDDVRKCDEVTFVCRRGNDSQIAAKKLIDNINREEIKMEINDLEGGLHAWASQVDEHFPIY